MAYTSSYDKLYENMKNRLTVIDKDDEYTLGEFMSMKAETKKADANLPAAERSTATKSEKAVALLLSFVNDKLTVKEPPVKDKTIRAFPFRASASALLSAIVACTFVLSFGIIGSRLVRASDDAVYDIGLYSADADVEIEADSETAYEQN